MTGIRMSFIKDLNEKNAARQIEWDADDRIDTMYRAVEFVGEVGELCNNIKKLRRTELGLAGSRCSRNDLESEFGDVMITLALLANECGVDLEQVTKDKFNATSDKMGFKTRFHKYDVTLSFYVPIYCNAKPESPYSFKTDSIDKLVDFLNSNLIRNATESELEYTAEMIENVLYTGSQRIVYPHTVKRNGIDTKPTLIFK